MSILELFNTKITKLFFMTLNKVKKTELDADNADYFEDEDGYDDEDDSDW